MISGGLYQDHVFGDITYEPVRRPPGAPSADIAIATATRVKFSRR